MAQIATDQSAASGRFSASRAIAQARPPAIFVGWRSWHRRTDSLTLFGRPVAHWIMLLALVAMWGSSFGLTKMAVATISAESVVAARMVVAGGLLFLLVFFTGRRIPKNGRLWAFFVAMAVLGNCLPYWLISWGQKSVDSALAGILMAVMPIATLLLAHVFVKDERMSWAKSAGFALGFVGVVILMGPEATLRLEGHGSALLAQLAIVGGAVCYAINTIVARICPLRDGLVAAAGTAIAANVIVAPVTLGSLTPAVGALDLPSASALLALGVVSTALAPVLYFRLVRIAGPTFLSLINYLIPVWALLVGMIFLGETPESSALVALALILGGIALSQLTPRA